MSLSLVQHKIGVTALNQTTVAVTVTATGAGNLLAILPGNDSSRTVSSIACGSDTPLQISGAACLDGPFRADIWWVATCGAGTTTITVTFSGAAGTFNKTCEVFEVSGFTTPILDVNAKLNTATISGGVGTGPSITTTGNPEFVAAAYVSNNNVSGNPNAGNEFTTGGDIAGVGISAAFCSLITTTIGAHQPAWTDGSGNFCSTVASFKESGGGASTWGPSLSDGWCRIVQRN